MRSVSPLSCEEEENLDASDNAGSVALRIQQLRDSVLRRQIADTITEGFSDFEPARRAAFFEAVAEELRRAAAVLRDGGVR